MEFFSPASRHIDDHLLATMRTIGSQIGQFMERKRVEEESHRLQAEVIRIQDALLQELSTPIMHYRRKAGGPDLNHIASRD
jgi:hypothetical protein